MRKLETFRFKHFSLDHHQSAQKIGTDSVLLATWIQTNNPLKILDIGSGCGLISFILGQRFPNAQITGLEVDLASYLESLKNLESFPWKKNLAFLQGDFLKHDFHGEKFDLIISNPPYFKNAFLSGDSKRDQARHEFSMPHLSLMEKCKSLLKDHGTLALVLPPEESQILMDSKILHCNRIGYLKNKAQSNIKRHLSEWSFGKTELQKEDFILRKDSGEYSASYKKLGKDYYLDF